MATRRNLRTTLTALVASFALIAGGALGAQSAQAAAPPLPTVMAALGDSISQATDSCGYRNCPTYSWSTGSASVNSHAMRLRALGASALVVYNDSVSGSTSANLLAQAQSAVTQKAQYITVQIGANDACTPTVAGMTPTTTFATNVAAALAVIKTGLPNAQVFVSSVPDLKRLLDLSKSKSAARFIWAAARICQSMLVRPTSTLQADVDRRTAVQTRVTEYNAALAAACAAVTNCKFDGNVVAKYAFTASHISTLDYFHPSISGQAVLSAITWPVSQYGAP